MNERIRELAEQATSTLSMNHEGYRGKGYIEQVEYFDKEKFAELIVKECATIINDIPSAPQGSWSDGYYEGCTDSAKQIKQHFGVEE